MNADTPIRVVLADDHPVVRLGMRNFLHAEPGIEVIAEASDGQSALDITRARRPDILLLDMAMPRLSGLDVLRELRESHLPTKTVILTASLEEAALLSAIELGARGLVLKDCAPGDIRQAIRAVCAGHLWFNEAAITGVVGLMKRSAAPTKSEQDSPFGLTAREREIISAVVEGCTNKDVAAKLVIAEDTVKRHITNIFNKLGMSTRVELAMFAVNHGLVQSVKQR